MIFLVVNLTCIPLTGDYNRNKIKIDLQAMERGLKMYALTRRDYGNLFETYVLPHLSDEIEESGRWVAVEPERVEVIYYQKIGELRKTFVRRVEKNHVKYGSAVTLVFFGPGDEWYEHTYYGRGELSPIRLIITKL
jgi:hypothetical protein